MKKRTVYLDHAAATPTDDDIIDKMALAEREFFANPAATFSAALLTQKALQAAKGRIASVLAVKPDEIVMTSGGSEANNLAIRGVMDLYPKKKVIISAIEHDSLRKPAAKYDQMTLKTDQRGLVDAAVLSELIDDDVVLLSVMLANNEIGTVQPISELGRTVQRVRLQRLKKGNKTPFFLHTDACQAPCYLSVEPHRLGVDLMTLNGGKIYGPKNVGVLYVASNVNLAPQILGGGQQRGLRSGSETVAPVLGMALAIEKASEDRKSAGRQVAEVRDHLKARLVQALPQVSFNGSFKKRLPNNLNVTLPGIDNERFIYELDEMGVMVAAGSACSASNEKPSHVLKAIGLSDETARSTIRLSLGKRTTLEDADYVVEAIKQRYNGLK